MAKIEPFEKYASEYDDWFEDNRFVYESELRAVQEQLPKKGEGIEVGLGSGRFAAPLGIRFGLDPSGKMRALAQRKGITAVDGLAEKLPFENCRFRFVLMVTMIDGKIEINMLTQLALPKSKFLSLISKRGGLRKERTSGRA